jgi:hypothetical protein
MVGPAIHPLAGPFAAGLDDLAGNNHWITPDGL